MTIDDLKSIGIASAAVTAVIVALSGAHSIIIGAWWPFLSSLRGAAVGMPLVVVYLLALWFCTNRPAWARNLTWIYHCDRLQPELTGWRHPIWRGSDDWPGDDTDTYWRRTIVIRIPGQRYLVVAVPIRRKHTWEDQ